MTMGVGWTGGAVTIKADKIICQRCSASPTVSDYKGVGSE